MVLDIGFKYDTCHIQAWIHQNEKDKRLELKLIQKNLAFLSILLISYVHQLKDNTIFFLQ